MPSLSPGHRTIRTNTLEGVACELANVRFGSKADMRSAQVDVRLVPIADIEGLPRVIASPRYRWQSI